MKCAVKNCSNYNNGKSCAISFFSFPSDALVLKQWVSFCRRNSNWNVKTSWICMQHFKPEDFRNNLEYEMGFCSRRLLNPGAVPTVRSQSSTNKERAQRCEKRENKKIVEQLIKEYDAALLTEYATESSAQSEETIDPLECQLMESEDFQQCHEESPSPNFANNYENNEIERIRQENADLKKTLENQNAQLRDMAKERDIYKNKIEGLTTRLNKANYELSNLERKLLGFLTKGQIAKLKSDMKRRLWTSEEMTQALFIYRGSSKVYNMLLSKHFPLPSVRTIQVALKKKRIMEETKQEIHERNET